MQGDFDPYEHWLGIPPAEQPPDYYRLLGIRPGESDLTLIRRAYQLRTDHVQLCDDGTYPDAAMRLRKHLAEARQVLFDPRRKQQYDATLPPPAETVPGRGGPVVEPDPPATAYPLRVQSGPELFSGSGHSFAGPIPSASPPAVKGTSSAAKAWLSWLISVVLALLVAVPILIFVIGRIPSGAPRPAANGAAHPVAGRDDRPAPSPPTSPVDSSGRHNSRFPAQSPPPRGPQTMADLMANADDDPADQDSVTGLLDAARRALAGRDFATADDHVQAAGQLARSPTEQASVRRFAGVCRSVEAFWKAVHAEASRLRGGEDLPVGDTRMMIVEAGARGSAHSHAGPEPPLRRRRSSLPGGRVAGRASVAPRQPRHASGHRGIPGGRPSGRSHASTRAPQAGRSRRPGRDRRVGLVCGG